MIADAEKVPRDDGVSLLPSPRLAPSSMLMRTAFRSSNSSLSYPMATCVDPSHSSSRHRACMHRRVLRHPSRSSLVRPVLLSCSIL